VVKATTVTGVLARELPGTALAGFFAVSKGGLAMRSDLNTRLTVEVRLLPDPCLWCWEIRDAERGDLVESSWTGEWTAYDSADEAYSAGRRRLTRLAGR
jgi:hypothetical protein